MERDRKALHYSEWFPRRETSEVRFDVESEGFNDNRWITMIQPTDGKPNSFNIVMWPPAPPRPEE